MSSLRIRKGEGIVRLEGVQPWVCRRGFGCEAGRLAFLLRPRLTIVE